MITLRYKGLFFEIRPLAENELGSALLLYQNPEATLAREPVLPVTMDNVEVDFEQSREDGRRYCGIFHPTGDMAGLVDYCPAGGQDDPEAATIFVLSLQPRYQEDGLAREVLEAVEAEVRQDPRLRRVLVVAGGRNTRALKFWRENGYEFIGGPPLLPAPGEPCYLRKEFDPEVPGRWSVKF